MTIEVPTERLGSLPVAPTEAEWRRMTPAERERFVMVACRALSEERSLRDEGKPHEWPLDLATQGDPEDLIGRLASLVAELEAKARQAVAGLRESVLAVLDARGIACPNEERARLMGCDDPATLRRWLSLARFAGSAAEAVTLGEAEETPAR
jgi:hypothetical protein